MDSTTYTLDPITEATISRSLPRYLQKLPSWIDRDDLRQQARLVVWKRQQKWGETPLPGSHVSRITKSVAIDIIRKTNGRSVAEQNRKIHWLSLDELDQFGLSMDAPDPSSDTFFALSGIDMEYLLNFLCKHFSFRDVWILFLRYSGVPVKDIARVMGISMSRVEQITAKIRNYSRLNLEY